MVAQWSVKLLIVSGFDCKSHEGRLLEYYHSVWNGNSPWDLSLFDLISGNKSAIFAALFHAFNPPVNEQIY